MPKHEEYRKIIDTLQNAQWCTEGLAELFSNLKGDENYHITEEGLYGIGLILEDIRNKIQISVFSLEKLESQTLKEKA